MENMKIYLSGLIYQGYAQAVEMGESVEGNQERGMGGVDGKYLEVGFGKRSCCSCRFVDIQMCDSDVDRAPSTDECEGKISHRRSKIIEKN